MPDKNNIGCLPTPQQELLLRAALLDGPAAIDAFHAWRSQVDFDTMDEGSRRLIPLLYKNLQRNNVPDSCMGEFKATYRQTFFNNQLLFYRSLPALRALKDAGIEVMLLKGAALAVSHYKQIGLRPMYDMDILVPTARRSEATAILPALGWTPLDRAAHAQGFRSPEGAEIDLHWHTLLEFSHERSDDHFWASASVAKICDLPVLVPSSSDSLFHVCIHGLKWNEVPPIRWIADAQMILGAEKSAENSIDWPRLLRHAKQHRLTLSLKESLQYLKCLLHAPIPEEVLAELGANPISLGERLDYASNICLDSERGAFLTFWGQYREYLHWARNHGFKNNITGLPIFLKDLWKAKDLRHLPILAVEGLIRRAFKRVKRKEENLTV
jgi:hypothetical protein